jgi:hypothetical protein
LFGNGCAFVKLKKSAAILCETVDLVLFYFVLKQGQKLCVCVISLMAKKLGVQGPQFGPKKITAAQRSHSVRHQPHETRQTDWQ